MEEKSVWMFLFFGLLVFCIIITILLMLNAGGLESKKKYNELRGKYADLANKHTKTLRTAIEMEAGNTNTNTNGAKKTEAELTKQNVQLQQQIKEQEDKIAGWRSTLLSDYKSEDEIREEIVRLKGEAAEYSKKEGK